MIPGPFFQILPDLGLFSYVIVAVLVAIQGPAVTLLAGYTASRGVMSIIGVIIAAIAGNTIADICWYTIGYQGRFERLIARFSFLRRHESKVIAFQEEMQEQGVKILVFTKLTMTMAVPALIAAGMARVPFMSWFPLFIVIEVIWTTLIALLAYSFGVRISALENEFQLLGLVGIILTFIVFLWFFRRVFKRIM